ncbi:NUDIX domain-containing protein [Ralstonia sp. 22086]|jgi:8-oxo-dGTP pyrophosphatase MutT (NUDIX family)|uniref:NUDIX domain-containing protein n=1 Tax=Ralstonia TaxID=48736 RepID=UPI001E3E1CEB|nr:NUDIX hydrolase [Ralstonia wenshanensis]MCT7307257.1 NUDIX hydrolase [Ralstonia wenshanensis]UGS91726.1 NUDIX hydrolase [Ralstonia wenshanensis]CAJ0809610.1 RNA pyrophosphohydrolase [Ralstonia wenshanensis]
MPIALSCGLVLLNEDGDVLLAHATETRHWDIPKGAPDPGENDRDAALRETREETGLVLDSHALIELGRFPYRRDKELHLFATRLRRAEVALDTLTCTSMFNSYHTGRLIPEMDAYRWTTADEVPQYASQSLTRLFAQTLTLASIDARLAEAGL